MFFCNNVQGFPAIMPELDLVEQEDQITHELSLDDDLDQETGLGMLPMSFCAAMCNIHVYKNPNVYRHSFLGLYTQTTLLFTLLFICPVK